MKKFLKIFLTGVLVLVVLFGISVARNVKKITEGQKFKEITFTNEDRIYESQYGWSLKVPEGWGKMENEFSKMEMLVTPGKQVGDGGWTYVAVEPIQRHEEVNKGGLIALFEDFFVGEPSKKQFPNSVLVQDSTEGTWGGYISYEFLFDHDINETRMRQFRRYLYPPNSGDGWLLYSQARVDDWEDLEPIIMTTIESFN